MTRVGQSTGGAFTNHYWTTWNPATHWSNVVMGDFTSDGKADIAGMTAWGDR
jgi:hypothetical protein